MSDSSVAQTKRLHSIMRRCLSLYNPRSFFLLAGAGSGKTRALVEAMKILRKKHGEKLRLSNRKVVVITYTNAACEEIKRRIDYDPVFTVSTIHSFAWILIRPHHRDICEWLKCYLNTEINSLKSKQERGRPGTKAYKRRSVKINLHNKRLDDLKRIKRFTYNPNGENASRDSLNHAEVINIAADFLVNKPVMRDFLVRKYPFLFIDESQDTMAELLNAFLDVQRRHPNEFCLALFGDTMQRIYLHGKPRLKAAIPHDWIKIPLPINHRCPRRIVNLINAIRSPVDDHVQKPRGDASEGHVRIFLVQDSEDLVKENVEAEIAEKMAKVTSDNKWTGDNREIKILTLEHHMAAKRGGFDDFFEPLYKVRRFKTGVLDGTLNGIPFFAQQVRPLVNALRAGDKFGVAQIVKQHSPLISTDSLIESESALEEVHKVNTAVQSLFSLWDSNLDPSLCELLRGISDTGLFEIPSVFAPMLDYVNSAMSEQEGDDSYEITNDDPENSAWENALLAPFSQLESYTEYVSDRSRFGTHQGIKGLEFPRVMVILDDNEARGFLFKFEKLLGAKSPSETDMKNEAEGKETSIDRTRRLFYVICSRAKSSLAIVVYTKKVDRVKYNLTDKLKWFTDAEIVLM